MGKWPFDTNEFITRFFFSSLFFKFFSLKKKKKMFGNISGYLKNKKMGKKEPSHGGGVNPLVGLRGPESTEEEYGQVMM